MYHNRHHVGGGYMVLVFVPVCLRHLREEKSQAISRSHGSWVLGMDHIQSFHWRSGWQELWSEGHWFLLWWYSNPRKTSSRKTSSVANQSTRVLEIHQFEILGLFVNQGILVVVTGPSSLWTSPYVSLSTTDPLEAWKYNLWLTMPLRRWRFWDQTMFFTK